MKVLNLTRNVIDEIKKEIVLKVKNALGADLQKCILYGSCARGDFSEDSDVDIALLVKCNRMEVKKYTEILAQISTEFAIKYFAIVNFVCIPYEEYEKNKAWYLYFNYINKDGVVLYGE